jgi:LCP family protein required for cell wall assembly
MASLVKRAWIAFSLALAIVLVSFERPNFAASAALLSLPIPTPTPATESGWLGLSTLLPKPVAVPPTAISIILLGTDWRPSYGDWRTDTMILVSVDVEDKSVSMVSIPRDLYVTIPGYGKTRLNMADTIGEAEHYPGGGPALLRATLQENLGLTFDHYVRVDFDGFKQIVDALGGIDVDVACPTELWVPNMKSAGDYLLFRAIPAGMQHMDGNLALFYSRCRAHTPAFDRDRRQREVLLAIRSRVLELGVSGLLPRLFALLDAMPSHIQTDLDLGEIVALAQLAPQIPSQNVNQGGIGFALAPEWITPQGSWVMLPERESIKESVEQRAPTLEWDEASIAAEGLRIRVENGTTIEGFAFQMAERLKARGYNVVEVGKADNLDHTETLIISHTNPTFTLDRLGEYLSLTEEQIRYEPDWLSRVAITVILGTDAQPFCR